MLPHVPPVEMPTFLSSRLVLPRLCFSFPCHSLSSCWASARTPPGVAGPAMAPSVVGSSGPRLALSRHGAGRAVRRSGNGGCAEGEQPSVAGVMLEAAWSQLFGGAKALPVLRASLPRGCVRGPFSPQPGPEAKISPGGSSSGLPRAGCLVFRPQTPVAAGSPRAVCPRRADPTATRGAQVAALGTGPLALLGWCQALGS